MEKTLSTLKELEEDLVSEIGILEASSGMENPMLRLLLSILTISWRCNAIERLLFISCCVYDRHYFEFRMECFKIFRPNLNSRRTWNILDCWSRSNSWSKNLAALFGQYIELNEIEHSTRLFSAAQIVNSWSSSDQVQARSFASFRMSLFLSDLWLWYLYWHSQITRCSVTHYNLARFICNRRSVTVTGKWIL